MCRGGTLFSEVWGWGAFKVVRAKWQKASGAFCHSSSGVTLPPSGPHGTPQLFSGVISSTDFLCAVVS